MFSCFRCQKEIQIGDRVGRRELCPYCSGDLHVCKNCLYFDPTAYNECRESQAERVLDKEKSNFCDFFSPGSSLENPHQQNLNEAKSKLENLFKK